MTTRQYKLQSGCELRLMLPQNPSEPTLVHIIPEDNSQISSAEVFGQELLCYKNYILPPYVSIPIFTWGTITVEVTGSTIQEYYSEVKVMKEFLKLHEYLDAERQLAVLENRIGPVVLVTGCTGSGKSSLCNILANYANRGGFFPLLVQLDVRGVCENNVTGLPCGLLGTYQYLNPHGQELDNLLGFFFGHSDIHEDLPLYFKLCTLLSAAVWAKLHNSQDLAKWNTKHEENPHRESCLAASGMIINAPLDLDGLQLRNIVEIFGVSCIVVLDCTYTAHFLTNEFEKSDKPIVLRFNKLDGVVAIERDRAWAVKQNNFFKYFRGGLPKFSDPFNSLIYVPPVSPQSTRLRLRDLKFLIISSFVPSFAIMDSAYNEITENKEFGNVRVSEWKGAPSSLINCVVGLASYTGTDIYNLAICNVSGLGCIVNVEEIRIGDDSKEIVVDIWIPQLLYDSCAAGANLLPCKYLLLGDSTVKWSQK